jgi:hypothetical protein
MHMATVINNPAPTTERIERVDRSDSSSGLGFVVGLVLLVLLAILLFAYGLPALRNASQDTTGGANINVPERMDINVNNPGSGTNGQ